MVLALPARAKLNLRLEVVGTLPDGRHRLRTEFVAVSLADLLEASPAAESGLEVSGLPLPPGENLVERARRELEVEFGRALPARLRLHKRIPAGAGLGGGSSDAAAALRALARLHGLEEARLPAVAARLGADVPFLLCGGTARATGAGEVLEPAPPSPGWYVIAWPAIELSTAEVYAAYDRVGGDGRNHLRRAAETLDPRIRSFASGLGDDWDMTGSGSAFFRHFATEAGARRAAQSLSCWTAVVRPVGRWC